MDSNASGKFHNVPMAFYGTLQHIMLLGYPERPRGLLTKELVNSHITILHPTERCLLMPYRDDNIITKCAETLWMLHGDGDLKWLQHYLSTALQWSDDGHSWRGAYGPRLRYWNGGDLWNFDQLRYVCNTLSTDPSSRQAVISIWNPTIDTLPGKDIPCNNWIQFLIRNGHLHMSVAQRSSDIWWGFSGIDAFSWTIVQQLLAGALGVNVGLYNHYIGSFHLYERHFNQAFDLLNFMNGLDTKNPYLILNFALKPLQSCGSLDDIYADLDTIFGMDIQHVPSQADYLSKWTQIKNIRNPLLMTMAQVVLVKESPNWETTIFSLSDMEPTDMWVALLEKLCRKNPAILDFVTSVGQEVYYWVYDVVINKNNHGSPSREFSADRLRG